MSNNRKYNNVYPDPICMECEELCDITEEVYDGSEWESWCYCKVCMIDTFHSAIDVCEDACEDYTYRTYTSMKEFAGYIIPQNDIKYLHGTTDLFVSLNEPINRIPSMNNLDIFNKAIEDHKQELHRITIRESNGHMIKRVIAIVIIVCVYLLVKYLG